jgi:DNA-binding transcriptional MerR regulator
MGSKLDPSRGKRAAIGEPLCRDRQRFRCHGGKRASTAPEFLREASWRVSDRGKLALTASNAHAKHRLVKTYSMAELTELTKFSARTIRQYIAQHLIEKPTLAGSATRYSRETLGKLLAIREWRFDQRVSTRGIRRALREWEEGEADAWAEEVDPIAPPPPPPKKPVGAAPVAAAPVVAPPKTVATAGPSPGDALGERWHHVPLMPGLMLLMREGAGEMTASVAREIQKRYRAG